MPGFLHVSTVERARATLDKFWRPSSRTSVLALEDVLGRVLAEDVISRMDVPPFDRASFDGYAVRASDTFGADEGKPIELTLVARLRAGLWPKRRLRSGECMEISTGAPIPTGADAVVMGEYASPEKGKVRIYRAVAPGENVAERGSDLRRGRVVLQKGEVLTHIKAGLLAAVGVKRVRVFSPPRIAVISTGDELARPGGCLGKGKIYDVNGTALSGAVRECGGNPVYLGIARDRVSDIRKLIRKGLRKCDILILSGGSSAGSGDVLPEIVNEMGSPGVIVHGLALKPGKPTFIAVLDGKPVFGLPGYPVSAMMVFDQLVADYIRGLSGLPRPRRLNVRARLSTRVISARGRKELIPVKMSGRDGPTAEPILKGSGAVTSLSMADGYIEVPIERELLEEGEIVDVKLFGGA